MFNFGDGFLAGLLDLIIPSHRAHAERTRNLQAAKIQADIQNTNADSRKKDAEANEINMRAYSIYLEHVEKLLQVIERHFPNLDEESKQKFLLRITESIEYTRKIS